MRRSNLRVSKSPKGVLQGSTRLEAHDRRLDPMTKVTIGVDLGDQYSQLYVVDAAGTCVETGRVRTTRAGLERWFAGQAPARVVLEAGTHSPWASRALQALGHEVLVANPRKLRGLYENDSKDDRVDAEYLARLRQVSGVGPVTALAYVLVLEDPRRFARSRAVGAYLGLRPRRSQSGERDPQLGITKGGNPFLRRLLVQGAQYILGPRGPDCDLRRHGERIAARGGKNAKKRAVIAVARKLAVLLHHLWISGEVYEPLRHRPALAQASCGSSRCGGHGKECLRPR